MYMDIYKGCLRGGCLPIGLGQRHLSIMTTFVRSETVPLGQDPRGMVDKHVAPTYTGIPTTVDNSRRVQVRTVWTPIAEQDGVRGIGGVTDA